MNENIHKFYKIVTRQELLGYAIGAVNVFALWGLSEELPHMVSTLITLICVLIVLPFIRKHGN